MIDSRNFSIKAATELFKYHNLLREKLGWVESAETVQAVAEMLVEGEKFVIPDGNLMFKESNGLTLAEWESGLYPLPYPITILEYEIDNGNKSIIEGLDLNFLTNKRIAVASEHQNFDNLGPGVLVIPLWYDESLVDIPRLSSKLRWTMSHAGAYLPYDQTEIRKDFNSPLHIRNDAKMSDLSLRLIHIQREVSLALIEKLGRDSWISHSYTDILDEVNAVIKFLSIYHCINVEEESIQPPSKVNKKRIKKGQIPYSEYKVLKLKANHKSPTKHKMSAKSDRSPPRRHKRRRHQRTLTDLRKVIVREHVVGQGPHEVQKDYLFTEE